MGTYNPDTNIGSPGHRYHYPAIYIISNDSESLVLPSESLGERLGLGESLGESLGLRESLGESLAGLWRESR